MAGILAPWHWVTLAAIIGVLFLGHRRLPGLGRALGQALSAFKRAWKEGAQRPNLAKESGPKRYPPSVVPSARQDSSRPRVGLLRLLLRTPGGRKMAFGVLLVLGIAYVAITLADGLLGGSSFRAKTIAFLGFFALGFVLLPASWLFHRQKGKASSGLDR